MSQQDAEIKYLYVKVVEAEALEQYQESGWVLIRVLKETHIVDVRHAMQQYHNQHGYHHHYDSTAENKSVSRKIKVHRFLLGKLPVDHAVSVLLEEKERLLTLWRTEAEQTCNTKMALDKSEAEKAKITRSMEEADTCIRQLREESSKSVIASRQDLLAARQEIEALKSDLKTTWQALGDLQMKEILGRDKP